MDREHKTVFCLVYRDLRSEFLVNRKIQTLIARKPVDIKALKKKCICMLILGIFDEGFAFK